MRKDRPAGRLGRALAAVLAAALLLAAKGNGRAPVDPFTSHAGELLIAAPSMPDPRFRESVILMLRHGRDGAMGLMVNKTLTKAPLAVLFDDGEHKGEGFQRTVTIHYGGPVEPEKGFVLHRRDYAMDGTMPVGHGFAFTSNIEVVEAMGEGKGPVPAMVAFGYAGWGAGQLEGEIAHGDWYWAPADDDLVFADDDAGKWKKAMAKRGIDL